MVYSIVEKAVNSLPDPDWQKPNLKLVYRIESRAVGYDSAGNEIGNLREFVVLANVKHKDRVPTGAAMAGGGIQNMQVEGRLINPKKMPKEINNEMLAYCEYEDATTGARITGRFRILPVTQNRIGAVSKKLGSRILGEILTGGAV